MQNTFLVWLVITSIGVTWAFYYKGLLPFQRVGDADGPVISSADLMTAGSLASMQKGTIEGFEYNVIAAGNGRLIMFVQLHQNTWLHFVAIGDKSTLGSLDTKSRLKHLKKVTLEGDFPDYFSLYCTPDSQQQLLQLFEPEEMANFVDFCRAYDFELFDDTIYVSQAAHAIDENDKTSLFSDVETLITKNVRLFNSLGAAPESPTAQI